MYKRKYFKQKLQYFILIITMCSAFYGCKGPADSNLSADQSQNQENSITSSEKDRDDSSENSYVSQKEIDRASKNVEYLNHFFNVEQDRLDEAAYFNDALNQVGDTEVPPVNDGEFTYLTAIQQAVRASGFEELALTYKEDKIKERLEYYDITMNQSDALAAYLICALDTSLIAPDEGVRAADGGEFDKKELANLLMSVADTCGTARNYLGYTNDEDIYTKLNTMWNSFLLFDDKALTKVGRKAVEQGITTGYNLKYNVYDAKFLPELTIQYGHSDIKHAIQLTGLLNSENITAKVQLEPKVSVYQYLLEWGPIPESTPTYEVRKINDSLYLVYAVEYDLMLEFNTVEDMFAFDSVIEKYAKKYEGNEEADGLLYSSWWQPLYSTVRQGMQEELYHPIYDCVISNENYSIHPFCLPDDLDEVTEALKAMNRDLTLTPVLRYCNTAFYHYLQGEDYQ